MTYPSSPPKMKHDLTSARQPVPAYPSSLISEIGFSNSAELFERLEEPLDLAAPPHKIGFVYSYSDAPDYPGPLSRSLIVLGVADKSISLVRRILSQEGVPDCLHKCTVAVQLGDAEHMPKLEQRHAKNSQIFSTFMKQLRKDEAVAIVAKDKHGRFAILAPMGEAGPPDDDPSTITSEDCAAFCYVGDAKEVMDFLATTAAHGAEANTQTSSDGMLWQPQGAQTSLEPETGLWQPPGVLVDVAETPAFSGPWENNSHYEPSSAFAWDSAPGNRCDSSGWGSSGVKRSFQETDGATGNEGDSITSNDCKRIFHSDLGAAAADAFYSGLTRSLQTRADSYLYHMRAFNGWVKATQIQELDPFVTGRGKQQGKTPLRVLDLACGKGGDLNKWALHSRGIEWYVGIDVARGSLRDAAIRAREMRKRNKLSQAIFTVADLGADVPGRKKSPEHKHMQKLLTWSLEDETEHESSPPEFRMKRGGGIAETDKFDVVSIQFAIHYMMSTRQRARRFFHTVSELLQVGGNLVCTTIDARIVMQHLMDLGHNYHFDSDNDAEFSEAVVEAGAGACKIRFNRDIVKRIVTSSSDGSQAEEELFGLQYTFTLVEGTNHAAGVGDAVNLPEWLTPLPVLVALAQEAGLELEYAQNFHEFYQARKNPSANPAAHQALYNMKVLNREGSISKDEWSVSRLYAAIKFRKVGESIMKMEEEEEAEDNAESDDDQARAASQFELDPLKAQKMLPAAMIKAKRVAGEEVWNTLSSEEKKRLTQLHLQVLARK